MGVFFTKDSCMIDLDILQKNMNVANRNWIGPHDNILPDLYSALAEKWRV